MGKNYRKKKRIGREASIKAILPDGSIVHHGSFSRGTFKRVLSRKHVRHSDKSFCINTSVIGNLESRGCLYAQFEWVMIDKVQLYEIEFRKALREGNLVVNEYGEENLRIPIELCTLIHEIVLQEEPKKQPEKETEKTKDTKDPPSLFNS